MKLGELLDVRRVIVPLKARSVREATRQLAKTMTAGGLVADEARLTALLKEEWPEDIVTVAGRAFLPHFRTAAVTKLSMALGVSAEPLCLANDPGRCARVVVLVLAPVEAVAEYLRAMSALAGALSRDDVLGALHGAQAPEQVMAISAFESTPVPPDVTVADVMTTDVASVTPKTPLAEASQLMLARGLSALPVTGPQGEVVGLLTEAHLLRHMLPAGKRAKAVKLVKDVMDRSVMCLSDDQTVADVATLMLTKEIERFPVTRDGALVGFLTRGDIVRKLLRT